MDTEAILARHPAVAVVDEFPHTNVPGSPRPKRWEDVHVLLDAGIDVLTTMNVQHLESLNDQIWQSTGVRVRETIPDWVVQAGRRGRDGGPDAARAAQPPGARRRLSARARAERRWRTSSRSRRSSRCANWRCARRRTASESRPEAGPMPPTPDGIGGDDQTAGRPAERLLLLDRTRSVERGAHPARTPRGRLPRRGVPRGLRLRRLRTCDDLPADERQQLERQLNFARACRSRRDC